MELLKVEVTITARETDKGVPFSGEQEDEELLPGQLSDLQGFGVRLWLVIPQSTRLGNPKNQL